MKTIKETITDVQLTQEGNIVFVTVPSKHNAKGVYVMKAAQSNRILQRAGIPNVYALKHLVSITNGTTKLSITLEDCKAGDVWENKTLGTTGVYEKDWVRASNHEVQLGFAGQMKLVEASLAGAFTNNAFSPVAPKVVVAPVASNDDEDNDVPNV